MDEKLERRIVFVLEIDSKRVRDVSCYHHQIEVEGNPFWNKKGGKNGTGAFEFDGIDDKIIIRNHPSLSPTLTGEYSVALWVRFDQLDFVGEGKYKDWVDFIGKKGEGNHEWSLRFYNKSNEENKKNRICGYQFNLEGGLGAGTFVQEPVAEGEWMHLVVVYGENKVKLYKNGILRREDGIKDQLIRGQKVDIVPTKGNADVSIGTTNNQVFFKGSIDDLRMYNYQLPPEEIQELSRK